MTLETLSFWEYSVTNITGKKFVHFHEIANDNTFDVTVCFDWFWKTVLLQYNSYMCMRFPILTFYIAHVFYLLIYFYYSTLLSIQLLHGLSEYIHVH